MGVENPNSIQKSWSKLPTYTGPEYWIVDGEAYDFSRFMYEHPGGYVWFPSNTRRDMSILFHTYHKRPEKLKSILQKYKMDLDPSIAVPRITLPPFLIKPDFDAARDVPRFAFDDPQHLLPQVRREITNSIHTQAIRRLNRLWDNLCSITLLLYAAASISLVFGMLSPFYTIPLLVVLRTSLAGWGHYFIHRKKPNWGDVLFDINYVGTSLTAFDGHVMLHHTFTQSDADVKSAFFFSMLSLPALWRIPGYTCHKLGNVLLGNLIRGLEINFMERSVGIWHHSFWIMRLLLVTECAAAALLGTWTPWFFQFFLTLWYNTFLVLSSHDFEHAGKPEHGDDWGVFQVKNSYDMTIVGVRWIDVFLSSGLSPHRVHHLLPFQQSGFANIYSERIVQKHCREFGIEWKPRKNLWTERLPVMLRFLFQSPPIVPNTGARKYPRSSGLLPWIQEQLYPSALADLVRYCCGGTFGIGFI